MLDAPLPGLSEMFVVTTCCRCYEHPSHPPREDPQHKHKQSEVRGKLKILGRSVRFWRRNVKILLFC